CALLARRKRAVCIFWPPSDWVLKTRRKAGWVPFFSGHGVHGRDCFGHLAGSLRAAHSHGPTVTCQLPMNFGCTVHPSLSQRPRILPASDDSVLVASMAPTVTSHWQMATKPVGLRF